MDFDLSKEIDRDMFIVATTLLSLQELKDTGLIEYESGYRIQDKKKLEAIVKFGLTRGFAPPTAKEFSQAIDEIQTSLY